MAEKIKLFVIDDSAIVRNSIRLLVQNDKKIELIGFANDPIFAMEKFKRLGMPDVIILDLEMPRMDGITFLKKIVSTTSVAVIICSGYAEKGSTQAVEALSLGAIDIINKPKLGINKFIEESRRIIINSIYTAAKAKDCKVKKRISGNNIAQPKSQPKNIIKKQPINSSTIFSNVTRSEKIIVIGSSTGGVQVLESIISLLGSNRPPILIVQHMPAGFTKSFADRLNRKTDSIVKEAEDGELLRRGHILVAPGGKQMILECKKDSYIVRVLNGPKINHHRPSVGALFRSCINTSAKNTVAFILTGMGHDGAHEIKQIRDLGGMTYAQNEESCVVFGMPREAIALGGIDDVLTPHEIAMLINNMK